jgi:5'-nucleotidase (lipoprotein e(P4) family)
MRRPEGIMRDSRSAVHAAIVAIIALAALCPFALSAAIEAGETQSEQGSLTANIYNQTSAEYRACCLSIYRAAGHRLEEILEDADPPPARPAVVMDLDETVLDISSFQTFLYQNGLKYTSDLWSSYEQEGTGEVELVPGAGEFIEKAETMGVAVVYLSNRNDANRDYTVSALERLGLDVSDIEERLYLRPAGASSNKSPRRDEIAARYNVLMIFGDDLRDFSEVFAPEKLGDDATTADYRRAIQARDESVDAASCHWGIDWFVLPNCMYGEWENLVPGNPVDIMRPTEMRVSGE